MENATEALIMGGEILIFIVALTVCISSFTTLRTNIDEIVGQTETVEMAKDTSGYVNYITSKSEGATRTVGAETVVTSMYRAVKENYVVYIKLSSYRDLGNITTMNATKTQTITVNSETKTLISENDEIIKIAIGTNQSVNTILDDGGLYNAIKGETFIEYLGEYQNASAATSENKQTFRIITYIQKTDI